MRKCFFAGLAIVLPLVITYVVLAFLIHQLTGPFEKLIEYILKHFSLLPDGFAIFTHKQVIDFISKLLILVGFFLIIYLLGVLSQIGICAPLFRWGNAFLEKIPIVRSVFRVAKEVTGAIFTNKPEKASQPAFVPYPTEDQKSMGLVMSEFTGDLFERANEEFVVVLIPCTPNPTTGVLCIFSKSDIVPSGMNSNEAFSFLMSFGTG